MSAVGTSPQVGAGLRLPALTITRSQIGVLLGWVLVAWSVVVAAAIVLAFGIGPVLERNAQARLVEELATRFQATQADRQLQLPQTASGLLGPSTASAPHLADPHDLTLLAPARGDAVALLQIPRLHLSQVVVEGVQPAQLEQGPGHVPGTALPGQPGTAGVVGTRTSYGALFRALPSLRADDEITVATAEGVAHYRVSTAPLGADPYAEGDRPRLVLTTSGPEYVASRAVSLAADLQGAPFAPTPRAGRDLSETGMGGQAGVWKDLVLLLEVLALVTAITIALYRRWHRTSTWLITTPPLVLLVAVAATAFSRMLPAAL
ncbi:sortase A [Phycicoccus badiiscoriae]|uniref:Sortase A n=1 Tax=Pedococcus badiiscoriae TaxID=642776 RepID=A0A852WEU3_9MICO|nr:class E sortase [Pedococcus badiiscoriae]NYG07299.1 sortase A [Pedococcus badiiscoriae]